MPLSRLSEMQNFCPTCFAFNGDPLCATCSAIDRLRAILIINLSQSTSEQLDGDKIPAPAAPLNDRLEVNL